jgi:hypothetical protein
MPGQYRLLYSIMGLTVQLLPPLLSSYWLMPGQYRMLYSIVVLSVQLLLPSAILILAHARSVQIAVHHRDDECTATAHARSVQVDVQLLSL